MEASCLRASVHSWRKVCPGSWDEPTSHKQGTVFESGPELTFQQLQIGHASSTSHWEGCYQGRDEWSISSKNVHKLICFRETPLPREMPLNQHLGHEGKQQQVFIQITEPRVMYSLRPMHQLQGGKKGSVNFFVNLGICRKQTNQAFCKSPALIFRIT